MFFQDSVSFIDGFRRTNSKPNFQRKHGRKCLITHCHSEIKREYFPGNIRVHPTPGSAAPDQPAETLRKDGERASLFKQVEQLFTVS